MWNWGFGMKNLVIVALVLLVAGCSTTSGTNPEVSYSGFDNARVVRIMPHGTACEKMLCTGIGADWSSATPKSVMLVVAVYGEYTAITGARLNIDGRQIELVPSRSLTDLDYLGTTYRESTKGFTTDLEVVRQILQSKSTWLRVSTATGYIDNYIIADGKDSKAFHALKRFIDEVNR